MSSGKPRPIHYPPHKVNEKPSDQEPVKSYENTSEYLEDDVYLSAMEQYHKSLGDLYLIKPPKAHPAAASRAAPQDCLGGGHHSSAEGGITIIPPSAKKTGKGIGIHINGFDDAKSLSAGSKSGSSSADDVFSRSPGSCPSFTSLARANADRGESLASQVSTLTEDEEFMGHELYDHVGFMQKWPSEAMGKPRGKNKKAAKSPRDSYSSLDRLVVEEEQNQEQEEEQEEEQDEQLLSSPRSTKPLLSGKKNAAGKANDKRHATKIKASEARKNAKFLAKKRARMRDIRMDALSGSAEFGHDTMSSLDDDAAALAVRTESKLTLDENRGGGNSCSSIGGKRAERLQFELGKASVTKRLVLRGLNLRATELPIRSILSFPLGNDLTKLCLAGNHLNHLPDVLVHSLQGLRTMDLQQCGLVTLPDDWDLPNLRRLNLSHNHLKTFLSEVSSETV